MSEQYPPYTPGGQRPPPRQRRRGRAAPAGDTTTRAAGDTPATHPPTSAPIQAEHSAATDARASSRTGPEAGPSRARLIGEIARLRAQIAVLEADARVRVDDAPRAQPVAVPVDTIVSLSRHSPLAARQTSMPAAAPTGRDEDSARRAYAHLRNQTAFTRAITESLGDGIIALDHLGRLSFMNPAAQRALGWHTAELLGKDIAVLLEPRDITSPTADAIHQRTLATGATIRSEEATIHRKDGSVMTISCVCSPIGDDGHVTGAVLAFHDIAARIVAQRALYASDTRFRATFQQAAVGMAHTTLDGQLLRANAKLCQTLGYAPDELLTLSVRDLTYADDLSRQTELHADLIAGKIPTYTVEQRYIHKDRSFVWIQLTVALVRDERGAPDYCICVVDDITERKHAEAERLRLMTREREARAVAEAATAELRMLQTVTDTALAHLGLDELLRELLVRVRDLMGVDRVAVMLADDECQVMRPRAGYGVYDEVLSKQEIRYGAGIAGRVALTGQPMVVDEVARITDLPEAVITSVRSMVAVPLVIESKTLGTLHASSVRPRHFVAAEVRLLQRVADRIALAIDRARMYEAAEAARHQAEEHARLLDSVFEAMADGALIYGRDGKILRMNRVARLCLAPQGVSAGSHAAGLERSHTLRVYDDQAWQIEGAALPYARLLRGETFPSADPLELVVRTASDTETILSCAGAPVRTGAGDIAGAVLTFRDVSVSRRLQRRTQQTLATLQNIAEVLVLGVAQSPMDARATDARATDEASPAMRGTSAVALRMADLVRTLLDCQRVAMVAIDTATGTLRPIAVAGSTPERVARWWAALGRSRLRELLDAPTIARLQADELVVREGAAPTTPEQAALGKHHMLLAPMVVGGTLAGFQCVVYPAGQPPYGENERGLARAVARLCGLMLERGRLLAERDEAWAHPLTRRRPPQR